MPPPLPRECTGVRPTSGPRSAVAGVCPLVCKGPDGPRRWRPRGRSHICLWGRPEDQEPHIVPGAGRDGEPREPSAPRLMEPRCWPGSTSACSRLGRSSSGGRATSVAGGALVAVSFLTGPLAMDLHSRSPFHGSANDVLTDIKDLQGLSVPPVVQVLLGDKHAHRQRCTLHVQTCRRYAAASACPNPCVLQPMKGIHSTVPHRSCSVCRALQQTGIAMTRTCVQPRVHSMDPMGPECVHRLHARLRG